MSVQGSKGTDLYALVDRGGIRAALRRSGEAERQPGEVSEGGGVRRRRSGGEVTVWVREGNALCCTD